MFETQNRTLDASSDAWTVALFEYRALHEPCTIIQLQRLGVHLTTVIVNIVILLRV